jgi:3-dehydroquinate synthase
MPVIIQKFSVPFEYPVSFTDHLFLPENPSLVHALMRREPWRRHRLFVVIDEGVSRCHPTLGRAVQDYAEHHRHQIELVGSPLIIPGGEAAKNDPEAVTRLQQAFETHRLDRHAFVMVIGGGAVLDLVGYAASVMHRGLRLLRVPTTVLAQCDSGLGVKNGINAFEKKNCLGVFAPPYAVFNDLRFLDSLPLRDRIAGMAEAVKVALIRDGAFFEWLTDRAEELATGDLPLVAELIRRSAQLHLDHIAQSGDPFEFGTARPLDFGHWAAHKLETLTHNRLRHGEAVAVGMAIDVAYSTEAGFLSPLARDQVLDLIQRLGLRLWDPACALMGQDRRLRLLDGLAEFREHLGGELTVTQLAAVGQGVEVHEMQEDLILRALDWLRTRDHASCG